MGTDFIVKYFVTDNNNNNNNDQPLTGYIKLTSLGKIQELIFDNFKTEEWQCVSIDTVKNWFYDWLKKTDFIIWEAVAALFYRTSYDSILNRYLNNCYSSFTAEEEICAFLACMITDMKRQGCDYVCFLIVQD